MTEGTSSEPTPSEPQGPAPVDKSSQGPVDPTRPAPSEPERTVTQPSVVASDDAAVMARAAPMPPVARGLQMKRRNPLAVWIGLPLITLGIYHYVWYYKIHHEMGEFDPRRNVPDIGPVLVLLLLGWTLIAPFI